MKYLITGGAGFIGSHLAEMLLSEGHEVYVIDDLSTGSIENIQHLKSNKNFHYVIDTIMNASILAEMIDYADIIVHLAAAVGVKLVVESPVRTIYTNVNGTELVLRNANKKKKKVLIASSSEVYGKSSKVPFKEDDDLVLGPTNIGRWSYACSKALDEFLALSYWNEKRLPVVILRFFNTVGPRQIGRYGMVIPRFIRQALAHKSLTVYGDGKQTRCFTYVNEVCNIVKLLSLEEKAIGNIYNIGSKEEISIENVAKRIIKKLNNSLGIKYIPYEEAYGKNFQDLNRRVPDTQKLYDLLGITPVIKIDEIIDKMVEYISSSDQI